ncbi:Chaperone protein ClpB [Porphyridium purpureum]|uniref:Chaperone protein ClpB n=1 Tax=Porphyridium purpureum TaxID=35688 RepID=A0A5J4ZAW9_PORPP|nr:Chaperone protein ClpB [Porphyridium purpureum]|eukprot:POR4123..scf295_1
MDAAAGCTEVLQQSPAIMAKPVLRPNRGRTAKLRLNSMRHNPNVPEGLVDLHVLVRFEKFSPVIYGRDEEVKRALVELRQGHNVLLLGAQGVGISTLLGAVGKCLLNVPRATAKAFSPRVRMEAAPTTAASGTPAVVYRLDPFDIAAQCKCWGKALHTLTSALRFVVEEAQSELQRLHSSRRIVLLMDNFDVLHMLASTPCVFCSEPDTCTDGALRTECLALFDELVASEQCQLVVATNPPALERYVTQPSQLMAHFKLVLVRDMTQSESYVAMRQQKAWLEQMHGVTIKDSALKHIACLAQKVSHEHLPVRAFRLLERCCKHLHRVSMGEFLILTAHDVVDCVAQLTRMSVESLENEMVRMEAEMKLFKATRRTSVLNFQDLAPPSGSSPGSAMCLRKAPTYMNLSNVADMGGSRNKQNAHIRV